jgi:PAS domain S-box-containing protein
MQKLVEQFAADPTVRDGLRRWLLSVALAAAVGTTYFLAAQLGLTLLTTAERVAVFWPATGVAAGILIALGPSARLPVAIGVIAATFAANLMFDRSVWSALAFGLCNVGEALVVMWLIERWFGPAFNLDSLRRVLGFFAAAAVATAAAAVGATVAMQLFGPSTAAFFDVWHVWFAADALGVITVAPLLIGVAAAVRDMPSSRELLEGTLVVGALAVAIVLLLAILSGPWSLIGPSVILFPLLLWLGYRCRPVFAAAAVFTVAAAIVLTTTHEFGRYGDPAQPVAIRVVAAQIAMLGTTLAALALAALFAELRRQEQGLQQSERKLRELLGALPAAIHTTDTAGRITFCNKAAVDLWGVNPELGKDKCSDLGRLYYPDGTLMPVDVCPTKLCLTERRAVPGREALFERPDGRRIPIIPYPVPLTAENGEVVGVVSMKLDISERKKAELALAERNIQLALAGKAALVGSFAYGTDTEIMQISEGYAAIHGYPEGIVEIARSECLATVHPDDINQVRQLRSEAFDARRCEYNVEYRIIRAGGEVRWVETRCFISYDGEGRPDRVVGVSIDITERKRVEEQQRRLVAELDHRVKNVLATVQAVAAHTMDASCSTEHFVAALDGRIRSMGSTHELLSHRRWEGIPLSHLVQRELAPYTTGSNTEISGPDVMLSAEASQTMAMVLHELVTNAAKYGSLSTASGRVSIRWRLPRNGRGSDRLVLTWREIGGPVVVAPSKVSYGVQVVRELIPYELGGTVDYLLSPEGAQCQMAIPLAGLRGGRSHANGSALGSFHRSDDIGKSLAG